MEYCLYYKEDICARMAAAIRDVKEDPLVGERINIWSR